MKTLSGPGGGDPVIAADRMDSTDPLDPIQLGLGRVRRRFGGHRETGSAESQSDLLASVRLHRL